MLSDMEISGRTRDPIRILEGRWCTRWQAVFERAIKRSFGGESRGRAQATNGHGSERALSSVTKLLRSPTLNLDGPGSSVIGSCILYAQEFGVPIFKPEISASGLPLHAPFSPLKLPITIRLTPVPSGLRYYTAGMNLKPPIPFATVLFESNQLIPLYLFPCFLPLLSALKTLPDMDVPHELFL